MKFQVDEKLHIALLELQRLCKTCTETAREIIPEIGVEGYKVLLAKIKAKAEQVGKIIKEQEGE